MQERRPQGHTECLPTRERILVEASRLFATRGFRGTSTRDICHAVGIQQPSLYKHFSSKYEIAEELVCRDLKAGIDVLARLAADGGGEAVELYRYLRWEITYDLESPFDLRALYRGDIIHLPELHRGRAMLAEYNRLLDNLLQRGIASGDFIHIDTSFVLRIIDVTIQETMRGPIEEATPVPHQPDVTAAFLVRALLRRPARLSAVRAAAHRAGL
jgi:AcrR family transcriptional regulator